MTGDLDALAAVGDQATLPSSGDLAGLTVVADGQDYVVGSIRTGEYVAVPELGARIIEWLQSGLRIEECALRAAQVAGEPVDVADFLTELAEQGLFGPSTPDGAGRHERRDAETGGVPGRMRQRLGRILFHPLAWSGYVLTTVAGLALMAAVGGARPNYRDAFPFPAPLPNLLVITALSLACAGLHELGHVLAAARLGVPSRVSVSRRLYFVTFQADLTRLWGLPRRARFGPLLAGMAWDCTVMGAAVLAEVCLQAMSPSGPIVVVLSLLRALALVQLTGLIMQALVFMRTDLYALFVAATGCKTLWATKGALLRRYLRRTTSADQEVLAEAGAGELAWARRYLLLYVPGVAAALWYLVWFAIPGLFRLLSLCLGQVRSHDLLSLECWEGLLALAIVVLPSVVTLIGASRSGLRVLDHARRARAKASSVRDRTPSFR